MGDRILVVEDDDKSRRLLVDVLTWHGYDVVAAESGEEGLREAAARKPDAVLLDMQLPGIMGFQVLEALRRAHGTVPVIAVTASAMEHDRERILAAGFDAYVAKPVNIRQVLDLLKNRLDPPPE